MAQELIPNETDRILCVKIGKLKRENNQLVSDTDQLKLSHGINSKPTESEKKFNWLVSLPS